MSDRYEPYCLADPTFYDSLSGARAEGLGFAVAEHELPAGWQRYDDDVWQSYRPPRRLLPFQGWKVHVSACLDNAERVLTSCWDYCVRAEIAFKFLRGRHVLHMRNAKYARRDSSGKLMTIYPVDVEELERVLHELGEKLHGEPGPYILSDLRWREGPLYVRYGGFTERYCTSADGAHAPAIEDPEGKLVPDQREAVFRPPEWVTLPDVLAPAVAARNATTVGDLPYRITRVLHFSNGGGLYYATDTRTGAKVVLKEARPHAGLDADGSDAVTRLRNEYRILDCLAGIDGIAEARDYFMLGEHEFLVLDHIDGTPLNREFSRRHPLADPNPAPDALADYTRWVLELHAALSGVLDAIHERGVVYGDLHLSNVLVQADGRAVLVDFEVASEITDQRRPTLANPGFATPPGVTGTDIDRYALACLGLALFLPITQVLRLDGNKARQLAEAVATQFPVPRSFLNEVLHAFGGEPRPRLRAPRRPVILGAHADSWAPARASLAAGIVTSATPDREDRLFPGDIAQFRPGGGLNIAHGAAGVLYALAVTGCGRFASFEEWLVLRARRPDRGTPPGFYDGLHGVAHVLDRLGHAHTALDLLDLCGRQHWDELGIDLFGGLSGIGINLAHFAARTGDNTLSRSAMDIAERVTDRLGSVTDVPTTSAGEKPYAGLLRGSSGPALLFVRLYEHTGDTALLDLAATALRQDLRRCARRDDGSLQVDEGWRTLPYVDHGSAGIGFVLAEYLAHRHDERFEDAMRAIRTAARVPFYIQSGLFSGRAGMLAYLSHRCAPGTATEDPEVRAHIRRLNWHALSYQGHAAFPGDQMLRLSMDLATGSAGILLALGSAMHDEPVALPLLEPSTSPAKPGRTQDFSTIHEGR